MSQASWKGIAGLTIVVIAAIAMLVGGRERIALHDPRRAADRPPDAGIGMAADVVQVQRQMPEPAPFLPDVALQRQRFPFERRAQDGDVYSACVLATAFDMCQRRKARLIAYDYPDAYLAEMTDAQADAFARDVEAYDHEMSLLCEDIGSEDAPNMDAWLLRSAIAGHPPSIARLLSLADPPVGASRQDRRRLAVAFREHAERMLNIASEAGEIRAIELVSNAYAMGEIRNAWGSVPIRADNLKALAASQALILIRDESRKRRLPFDAFDDRDLRAGIASRLASMPREDLARFSSQASLYFRAYWARYDKTQGRVGPLSELPDRSCEALRPGGSPGA